MILESKIFLEGLEFPEGPRWRKDKLWFSDMQACRVMNVDLEGNAEHVVDVWAQPSGLGWLPDGSLLIVSMGDQQLLRLDSGNLEQVADLSTLASGFLNDMVVDREGRAYVGNFGYTFSDPNAEPGLAEIILVTPDGNSRIVANEMAFPNGSVITPDGETLIVAETLASRLTAFDIGPDGSLTGRRTWARFDDRGFEVRLDFERISPDGICLDAEGALWVASPSDRCEVLRVLEGGEITHRVKVQSRPLAAMLGGVDRKTLFVCTSSMDSCLSQSGSIHTVRVDVPGVGYP